MEKMLANKDKCREHDLVIESLSILPIIQKRSSTNSSGKLLSSKSPR